MPEWTYRNRPGVNALRGCRFGSSIEQFGLTHGLTNDAVIEFGLVEFKTFLTGAQDPLLLPCSGKHQPSLVSPTRAAFIGRPEPVDCDNCFASTLRNNS